MAETERTQDSTSRYALTSATPNDTSDGPKTGTDALLRVGLFVCIIGLGGFLFWAALAPLQSAVVVPGAVRAAMGSQKVEHTSGGRVMALHVSEGERVKSGQLMVELSESASRARRDQMDAERIGAILQRDRLQAELDRRDILIFSDEVQRRLSEPEISKSVATQVQAFDERRASLEARKNRLVSKKAQLIREIEGLEVQLENELKNKAIVDQALKRFSGLEGAVTLTTLDARRREALEADTQVKRVSVEIDVRKRQIEEADLELADVTAGHLAEAAEQLQRVDQRIHELTDSITAAESDLDGRYVRASADGTIIGVAVDGAGDVLDGGETLLRIVPDGDELIIETIIPPTEIDNITVGQKALVRISAFNSRTSKPFQAELVRVSPDIIRDTDTGARGYTARLRFDQRFRSGAKDVAIQYGMPAEVMIITGKRTVADYFLEPVINSFNRSFRESG